MWKPGLFLLLAVPVLTNNQCRSCDPATETETEVSTETDPPAPCEGYVAQASEEALAGTPRARTEIEQLAITLGTGLTADPEIYERLVMDLEAIWDLTEAVDGVTYLPPHDGRSLLLGVDATTQAAIDDGTYTAWDCANEAYGLDTVQVSSSYVRVSFDGIYDLDLLAEEYADLPGIDFAEPDYLVGDGDTVCVTPEPAAWNYVMVVGWGDCPSGCIHRHYHHYATEAPGDAARYSDWSSEDGGDEPMWVRIYGC